MLQVSGEPGKTAGPTLRGAAGSRRLQKEPFVHAHPPAGDRLMQFLHSTQFLTLYSAPSLQCTRRV